MVVEQLLQRLGINIAPRQIGGKLPQVCIPVVPQHGIDLFFQVTQCQAAQRRLAALLQQKGFELFDICLLRLGELTRAQLVTGLLDPFQQVTQLAGGAACGRRRIIQLMS